MTESENLKRQAAERAVEHVRSGMVVGLGTGSTAVHAVRRIGALLAEGQLGRIIGIPTSEATAREAERCGVPLGVLEALACRKPVLSTTYGALPDALRGVDGVHFSSPAHFVRRLADLIDNPERLSTRPEGLPDSLDARRVVDAVIRAGATT